MKSFLLTAAIALGAVSLTASAQEEARKGAILLTTPAEYQVYAVSPNGQWACGTFVNGNNASYAFRWDLQSGNIELLSGDDCESEGKSVSNNGVVSGTFTDYEATSNGAPLKMVGYWKDGAWHHVEIPGGHTKEYYLGGYISPDGQYVGGGYCDVAGGNHQPIIWKEGKVDYIWSTGIMSNIYAVSPDGQCAAGWSTPPQGGGTRVATLWRRGSNEPQYLTDPYGGSPWESGRKFSPNGKLLLYWGCYVDYAAGEQPEGNTSMMGINSIYNMETGEVLSTPTISENPFNFDLFDISDNGTVVGYEQAEMGAERAIISENQHTQWIQDWLEAKGVDLSSINAQDLGDGELLIARTMSLSNDEKTFAMVYYDNDYSLRSVVVKLDENISSRPPVQVEARELVGIPAAIISWGEPLVGADGVLGYNIYRDGVKLNGEPLTATTYVDHGLEYSDYTYAVSAIYEGGESELTDGVSLSRKPATLNAPYGLTVRQKGMNSALLTWNVPQSNQVVKRYYETGDEVTGFGGGDTGFESAIRFEKDEISLYSDYKIGSVCFYPMSEQKSWKLNIYKSTGSVSDRELILSQPVTQPLEYGVANRIELSQPLDIPTDADLYVAIEVEAGENVTYNMLGQVYGRSTPGRSDLVRQLSESDFYSLSEAAAAYGGVYTSTWAIDVELKAEGQSPDIDRIDRYDIYSGEAILASTNEPRYEAKGLSNGSYDFGVRAVYAGEKPTDVVRASVSITKNSAPYTITPFVTTPTEASVWASWDAPSDNDETFISYAGNEVQGGILGTEEDMYSYMVSSVYPAAKVRPYGGYELKAFRFYPLAEASFTFLLLENGVEVAAQEPVSYQVGSWNTVPLSKPITINPNADYQLIIDCYDVEWEKAPIAIDNDVPFTGQSDLYSVTGDNFASVGGVAAVYGNWMMGMVVADPAADVLPVSGYKVVLDGHQQHTEPVAETTFSYDYGTADESNHRIRVDVVLADGSTSRGEVVYFNLGNATSISDVVVNPANDGAPVYDLSGRRLNAKPQSGIYIQGGKKYLAR